MTFCNIVKSQSKSSSLIERKSYLHLNVLLRVMGLIQILSFEVLSFVHVWMLKVSRFLRSSEMCFRFTTREELYSYTFWKTKLFINTIKSFRLLKLVFILINLGLVKTSQMSKLIFWIEKKKSFKIITERFT